MLLTRRTGRLAIPVALAFLVLAGCSSGDSGTAASGSGAAGGQSDAAIIIDGVQPENPLVPGNTNETGGSRVVEPLYTGLVQYATKDAAPELAMAESIESPDSKVYTIKLKSGWTFHDGSPVTADSFIDAWNWVAYSPNGALNASFMNPIQGFADVNTEDPDGDGPQKAPEPKSKTMSGLAKVDDLTFTVTLTEPFSPFESMVGYTTFAPLPPSFFSATDKTAWGKKPVGNGPFSFVSWTDNQEIKITRFEDYKGTKPKVKDVTVKIYQDQDAAYSDLTSNNLDFQQQVPVSAIAGDTWKSDLGDRALERPVLVVQTMTFPLYAAEPKFKNKDFRHAISMAVNRDEITKQIFNGTRTPAKGYSSPAVAGYQETCGEFCTFDPAKAKAALAKAGGFTGKLTLSYNGDGDHKAWTEAVCNSIRTTLSIDCQATPVATFAVFRQQINGDKMTGLFRTGWQYDYPNLQNGLGPLFRSNASANDGSYSNPAFDTALDKANQAPAAEANALYVDAEKILVEDMPAVPLWTVAQQSGISTKLKNAEVNAFGNLDLIAVGT